MRMHARSTLRSAALRGVEAQTLYVETELSQGLPCFSIIGMADKAIQEAKFRIQAALRASGIELPHKRITINLAPAGLRKDGAALDLPMTLSLLGAAGIVPNDALQNILAVGELALSGELRPIAGALPIADLARSLKVDACIVPQENGAEAASVDDVPVVAPASLVELVRILRKEQSSTPIDPSTALDVRSEPDFADVKGQALARRALEIAAAGEHNVLLLGNPGGGKTMMARRLPGIFPPLSSPDRVEVTKVWSAAGLTIGWEGLLKHRPFRAPHHSLSAVGLIGGGNPIRPGEVSLAHRGVLFLDEMFELPRNVLEGLRQPMEDKSVTIVRARQAIQLPAAFMLVGAANPCPCGWLGHPSGRCRCREDEVLKYRTRVSGALLDRIDLVVETPSLPADEILDIERSESSAAIRSRVEDAQGSAIERAGAVSARLDTPTLKRSLKLSTSGRKLFVHSVERLKLSARAMERTLRVARTISDLEQHPEVTEDTVAEALQYRPVLT